MAARSMLAAFTEPLARLAELRDSGHSALPVGCEIPLARTDIEVVPGEAIDAIIERIWAAAGHVIERAGAR